ncbi:RNA-binding protein 48-like isoform X1 [Salvia splendens]|uniref:RNA-binding protein 48-like isoform X1 n=1 Tax=Salvia splendens TaxID=180675 RepID=UPI001C27D7FB|nr:RNA-binding protein 48-like isoform X1 [Salvia splendens]
MPKLKNEPPAVRVYTVCDESRYLIVRNVPSLGCGDELLKLFSTYGPVAECKPMDAEECEAYTDVYWIKFHQLSNARFAKRKLDESVFLGNQIQVTYAPEYESLSDTKDKLEGRRKEVLARLNRKSKVTYVPCCCRVPLMHCIARTFHFSSARRSKGPLDCSREPSSASTPWLKESCPPTSSLSQRNLGEPRVGITGHASSMPLVSTDKEYFPSESMNETVKLVREKLNKIESCSEHGALGSSKKARVDNRRRI